MNGCDSPPHFDFQLFMAIIVLKKKKKAAAGPVDLVVRYFGLDGLWLACSAQPSGSRMVSHSDTWEWVREATVLPLSCSHHNVEP